MMTSIERTLLRFVARAAVWLVKSPFVIVRALYHVITRMTGASVLASRDALPCPAGCGEMMSLVGRWQCGWCQYVFDGFAFARCDICGAVPPYLECQNCGAGLRNPMLP